MPFCRRGIGSALPGTPRFPALLTTILDQSSAYNLGQINRRGRLKRRGRGFDALLSLSPPQYRPVKGVSSDG